MDSADKLSIYYQNCNGIRTKLHTLYMKILSFAYDIIVLTETWLVPEIHDNEFIDQRYVVFRCDRDRLASGKRDGGGVLVAILRGLQPAMFCPSNACFTVNPSCCIEHLLIEFPSRDRHKNHVISAAYLPPCTKADTYESHFDYLQDILLSPCVEIFFYWEITIYLAFVGLTQYLVTVLLTLLAFFAPTHHLGAFK